MIKSQAFIFVLGKDLGTLISRVVYGSWKRSALRWSYVKNLRRPGALSA